MADDGFSAEEREAMKARAAELKSAKRRGAKADKAAADAQDVADRIAEMPESDRVIAEALHQTVMEHAPNLLPKTWYGMPAYALDGKVVVFFKPAAKFKVRYAEVGFNEHARLDDGVMWPTVFAVTAVTPQVRQRLRELIVRATQP